MLKAQESHPKKGAIAPVPQPQSSTGQSVRPLTPHQLLRRSLGNGYLHALSQTHVLAAGAENGKSNESADRVVQQSASQNRLDRIKTRTIQRQEALEEEDLEEEDLEAAVQQQEDSEDALQMEPVAQSELNQNASQSSRETSTHKLLQRKGQSPTENPQTPRVAPPEIETAIEHKRSSGQALDTGTRLQMEVAFGTRFSKVRVHTDGEADKLNHALGARAFTTDQDIFFRQGEYNPGSTQGRALLAHELTHVVQQRDPQDNPKTIRKASIDGGCVTDNLDVVTSGALQGGWSVHDYLSRGTWGPVTSPKTAGPNGTGFKVQIVAPFSGEENLGVSQTLQHGESNPAFLEGTARYIHKPGSVKNGQIIHEPLLNPGVPFGAKSWTLKYKNGIVSFADVPGSKKGEKGYIDFVTTFHSRGEACKYKTCSVTWRWQVDFTGKKNVNSVTRQFQSCT